MAMPKQFETVLPEGFDGLFRFTNASKEDFVGIWGNREYLFPAERTTPMIIDNATPLETQVIRKKFARDLAEREFFKSKKYEVFRNREGERDEMGMIKPRGQGMSHAATYNDFDLQPFIAQCLVPLPPAAPTVSDTPALNLDTEEHLTKDDSGEPRTEILDDKAKVSLKERALKGGKKAA